MYMNHCIYLQTLHIEQIKMPSSLMMTAAMIMMIMVMTIVMILIKTGSGNDMITCIRVMMAISHLL